MNQIEFLHAHHPEWNCIREYTNNEWVYRVQWERNTTNDVKIVSNRPNEKYAIVRVGQGRKEKRTLRNFFGLGRRR